MEQKPRFLIYSSKEVVVLLVLGAVVAAFAFTYGIHLGKRVSPKVEKVSVQNGETPLAEQAPDASPNRQEVDSQARGTTEAAETSMSQALRDEVTRTGVRVETPKSVHLPQQTRSEKIGTTKTARELVHSGAGKYSLQLGAFATVEEAKAIEEEVGGKGIKASIRPIQVQGKKLFRVITGSYANQTEAEDQGKALVLHQVVDTFVVVPSPDRR